MRQYKNVIIIGMNILSSLLVALGLSMDNFAVTVASGCCHRLRIPKTYILKVSVLFALAHFAMFSAGWLFGAGAERYIGAVDHWIAFLILVFIGGRMIKESRGKQEKEDACELHSLRTLLALAVATSVDALLVGMGLAFTAAPFWPTVWTLSACVLATSAAGFWLGAFLGRKFGKIMEALGGVVLIVIGLKLLLEGLGIW